MRGRVSRKVAKIAGERLSAFSHFALFARGWVLLNNSKFS